MMRMNCAYRFELGTCSDPKCKAVHFWLFDEGRREPFATMTIAVADVPRITEKMRDTAYQIAATKGDA